MLNDNSKNIVGSSNSSEFIAESDKFLKGVSSFNSANSLIKECYISLCDYKPDLSHDNNVNYEIIVNLMRDLTRKIEFLLEKIEKQQKFLEMYDGGFSLQNLEDVNSSFNTLSSFASNQNMKYVELPENYDLVLLEMLEKKEKQNELDEEVKLLLLEQRVKVRQNELLTLVNGTSEYYDKLKEIASLQSDYYKSKFKLFDIFSAYSNDAKNLVSIWIKESGMEGFSNDDINKIVDWNRDTQLFNVAEDIVGSVSSRYLSMLENGIQK